MHLATVLTKIFYYMGMGRIEFIKSLLPYIGEQVDFGPGPGKEFFRLC